MIVAARNLTLAALTVAGTTLAAAAAFAQAKGDRAFGEYLSSECVTCHQLSGDYKGIPPIIGWPEESFVHIMNEYRTGTRENQVMRTIAKKFNDEEVLALAAYFGALTPK